MSKHRWIGLAIVAIAAIHTLFGLLVFGSFAGEMVAEGLFNTVGEDAMRGGVTWFLISGFFMATTGLAIDRLEANGLAGNLGAIGWMLLAIVILGIVLMPVSGFWLLLVPAIFAIRAKNGTTENEQHS